MPVVQSFPLFFSAQMPRGFEDISKDERSENMKYHAVWKPGGRTRRGMGSMKSGRRQFQALKPRGTIPGKGAKHLEQSTKKAA